MNEHTATLILLGSLVGALALVGGARALVALVTGRRLRRGNRKVRP